MRPVSHPLVAQLSVAIRAVAFPVCLRLIAPQLADELFFAVLRDSNPALFDELKHRALPGLRVWLPVFLQRYIPLVAIGVVLAVASRLPLIGWIAVFMG